MNYDLPFSISVTFATTPMRDEKSAGERRAARGQSRRQPRCTLSLRFPALWLCKIKKKGKRKKMATPAER